MQITFDAFGDVQLQPVVLPSVARKPAVSAPEAAQNAPQDQRQRQENQARQAATPTLSFQNALAAQESNTSRVLERDNATAFGPDNAARAAISAYDEVVSRSTPRSDDNSAFTTVPVAPEQTSVDTQSSASAPNDAFIRAAAAYTDRVLDTSSFARPGETLRFDT